MAVDTEVDELRDLAGGQVAHVDVEMVIGWGCDQGAGAQQTGDERQGTAKIDNDRRRIRAPENQE
ncbi:MAG: hypothetical protein ACR2FE_12590 [Aeromicrobium sp.]